jgi:iron complex transport system substrate-binding protein
MRKRSGWLLAGLLCLLLTGCGGQTERDAAEMQVTGSMELTYADQFAVTYYDGGFAGITIGGSEEYLLVPEGESAPEGLDDVVVLQQPIDRVYLAASSAMDLFRGMDALDAVCLTSTTAENWSIPEVKEALESGAMQYAGSYSTPDYELVMGEQCDLAIESTMISHSPETKEQLERLGIPVLVERSSYESHPLGRLEWIKLYGLLLGKTEEAEECFERAAQQLDEIADSEASGKTVAFFSISTNGYATVHKPGDYLCRMIELAGGTYIFTAADLDVEENALSTMNVQLETFYDKAKDADYLIYNSAIDGELESLDQLLDKWELLKEFRAVQENHVWCTEKNLFQQTTGAADMIADLHAIVSDEAENTTQLTFLHRLE